MAIRILCGRAQQKAVLWANSSGVTNLPQQQPTCQVSLRGCGLPHQCAHWFAMTDLAGVCAPGGSCNVPPFCRGTRIATPVCALVRNDMQKAGTCSRVQGRSPLSLRGAKRRDNPFSLRQRITKSNTLGEYESCCGFATTAANLSSISAGMRIATPVCALVRNDMQKTGTCSRVQGRPPIVIARSEATGQSVFSAAGRNRKQYFGRIRQA